MLYAKPLLLLVAAGAFMPKAQDETVTLRWKPSPDYTSALELKLDLDIQGQPVSIMLDAYTKVKKIETDGKYATETVYKNNRQIAGGQEQTGPDSEPMVSNYEADGTEIKAKDAPENPFEFLGWLSTFEPKDKVKVGDTWTIEKEKYTGEYKLESKEKLDDVEVFVIKANIKVKGNDLTGTGSGTVWLRAVDFDVEKVEGKFTDFKPSSDAPPLNAKLLLKKKK